MLSWTRHLKILNRLSFEIYNVCRPYLTYFLTWKRRKVKLFDVERSFKNFAKFLYRKRHNLSQRNITVTHFNFEVGFGSTVIRTSFWCLRKRWSQFGQNVKTQIKMSKKNHIFRPKSKSVRANLQIISWIISIKLFLFWWLTEEKVNWF